MFHFISQKVTRIRCLPSLLDKASNDSMILHRLSRLVTFSQDRSGLCPLHRAAQRGNTAAASALLEAGANIEEPTLFDAATPLLLAASEGQERFARFEFDCFLEVAAGIIRRAVCVQIHSSPGRESSK
jgi:ankyrin repeat protein